MNICSILPADVISILEEYGEHIGNKTLKESCCFFNARDVSGKEIFSEIVNFTIQREHSNGVVTINYIEMTIAARMRLLRLWLLNRKTMANYTVSQCIKISKSREIRPTPKSSDSPI